MRVQLSQRFLKETQECEIYPGQIAECFLVFIITNQYAIINKVIISDHFSELLVTCTKGDMGAQNNKLSKN